MKHCTLLLIVSVVFFHWSSQAHANYIIFQDNFNEEAGGGIPYFNFHNWTVSDGTVDVVSAPTPTGSFNPYPADGFFVDLAGSGTPTGLLTTKTEFNLAPGEYELTFLLAGRQLEGSGLFLSDVHVELGSLYSETISLPYDQPFTLFTRSITVSATTSAALSFQQTSGDLYAGALLDDVALSAATVPVPPTLALLGCGFLVSLPYLLLRRRE